MNEQVVKMGNERGYRWLWDVGDGGGDGCGIAWNDWIFYSWWK